MSAFSTEEPPGAAHDGWTGPRGSIRVRGRTAGGLVARELAGGMTRASERVQTQFGRGGLGGRYLGQAGASSIVGCSRRRRRVVMTEGVEGCRMCCRNSPRTGGPKLKDSGLCVLSQHIRPCPAMSPMPPKPELKHEQTSHQSAPHPDGAPSRFHAPANRPDRLAASRSAEPPRVSQRGTAERWGHDTTGRLALYRQQS